MSKHDSREVKGSVDAGLSQVGLNGDNRDVIDVKTYIACMAPADTASALGEAMDLRSILDSMSEGFALLGPDFTIIDVNAEALRQGSRTRDQLVGQSHWDVYPGTEHSALGQAYKRATRERVPVTLEHQQFWADGRTWWLDMRAYPTDDGNLAVFFRDVTERHDVEHKLRESEKRFRGAVDAFADVLWTNNADGRMVGEQSGWSSLTGQAYDEYQGYGWTKAVHPDDAQPTLDAWQVAVAEQRLFAFKHRVRHRDGRWRWFNVRAVPTFDDDGAIREWVGVHCDITDLHNAEARQALFCEHADNVRDLTDVREIVAVTVELLGKHLEVSRVGYGEVDDDKEIVSYEIDYADGINHLVGKFPLVAFGSDNIAKLRRGITTVYHDVRDPGIADFETRAAIVVPLVRSGRLRAALYVNHRAPRVWHASEISLVQEVAARTWDALERARAEADLRESEMRFRQLANNVDVTFYVHEIDEQRISFVSPAYEHMWNQPVSELYADATAFMRNIHPEDYSIVDAAQRRQLLGEDTETRYRLILPDDRVRHIHDRAYIADNTDGDSRRVVGLAEDVTTATEARLQLAANVTTVETMVRGSPFGIYVVDGTFCLLEISEGAKSVFAGIEPLIGRDFAEILRIVWEEPFASTSIERFHHTLVTGERYVSLKTIEARSNIKTTEAYDWRIERIVLPDGSHGIVCYFYDLSERMALEASLNQALTDKDILLREVDHRVRNSMSMVAGLLSIQGGLSDNVEVRQALSVAALRMQAVARVHERLYKGKQPGVVEFKTYLEEICQDLRASLQHNDTGLTLKTVPITLSLDQAVPLGLITNELVTNAFKHCGDLPAMVTVELASDANTLTLTVSDTGVGMPKDYSASGRKGLGMQVIELLTQQLGGTLALPKAGKSARFELTVPVDRQPFPSFFN